MEEAQRDQASEGVRDLLPVTTPYLPMLGGNIVVWTMLYWPMVHPALQESAPLCRRMHYMWDGEYEMDCELRRNHPGPHYDGYYWFDDSNEVVDPPGVDDGN